MKNGVNYQKKFRRSKEEKYYRFIFWLWRYVLLQFTKLFTNLKPISDVAAILSLPLLFPPTTVPSKVKRKDHRPSKLEVQESFVLHVVVSFLLYNLM
jgi:hypothetical protein